MQGQPIIRYFAYKLRKSMLERGTVIESGVKIWLPRWNSGLAKKKDWEVGAHLGDTLPFVVQRESC